MRTLYKTAQSLLPEGFYFKIRYGLLSSELSPLAVGLSKGEKPQIPTKDHHIVIVGGGFAGVHFACRLRELGFQRVSMVNLNDHWGGKCVFAGCMPSELFFAEAAKGRICDAKDFDHMSETLSGFLKEKLIAHGVHIVLAEAKEVLDQRLITSDGKAIDFDTLVLATGNHYKDQTKDQRKVDYYGFWRLQQGRVVLRTGNNPHFLGLAEACAKKGLDVTLVFEKNVALHHLPAIKHMLRELSSKKVTLIENAGPSEIDDGQLKFKKSGRAPIAFDHILSDTDVMPRTLPIDGETPSLDQLRFDFFHYKKRGDVYFVGDAAGFLSVTEGEWQADLLAQTWIDKKPARLRELEAIPMRLHGQTPLAMVGAPYTLLSSDWEQVDFRSLGYSFVNKQAGALWFKLDKQTATVEAFHIYHPHANELIAIAHLLLGVDVRDSRWSLPFVHPSAGEVFKLVRDRIQAICAFKQPLELLRKDTIKVLPTTRGPTYQLPTTDRLGELLSKEELKISELTAEPDVYLRLVYGLKKHKNLDRSATLMLKPGKGQTYQYSDAQDFGYTLDQKTMLLQVKCDGQEFVVI